MFLDLMAWNPAIKAFTTHAVLYRQAELAGESRSEEFSGLAFLRLEIGVMPPHCLQNKKEMAFRPFP